MLWLRPFVLESLERGQLACVSITSLSCHTCRAVCGGLCQARRIGRAYTVSQAVCVVQSWLLVL